MNMYWLMPYYLSEQEKRGIWIAIRVIIVSAIAAVWILVTTGTGSSQCGDYTLKNGSYIYTKDRGEYDREGTSYFYVGCKKSRGGWFFGVPGSGSGSGSGYRGGGPGTGK